MLLLVLVMMLVGMSQLLFSVSPRCILPVFHPQTEEGSFLTWSLEQVPLPAGWVAPKFPRLPLAPVASPRSPMTSWAAVDGVWRAPLGRLRQRGRFKTRFTEISPPAAAGGSCLFACLLACSIRAGPPLCPAKPGTGNAGRRRIDKTRQEEKRKRQSEAAKRTSNALSWCDAQSGLDGG